MWASILLTLQVLVLVFVIFTPKAHGVIDKAMIAPETGSAYSSPVQIIRFPYTVRADTNESPRESTLIVLEDGHALGPAHSLHAKVREDGGGRYSHWNDILIWSTSDNSDPRSNGRLYSIESSTAVRTSLQVGLWSISLLADLLFLLIYRKQAVEHLRARGTRLLGIAALLALALLTTIVFAWGGRYFIASGDSASDAALIVQSAMYAVLGCIIPISTWMAGAGPICLLQTRRNASLSRILIPAYPVSLAILAALAAISLLVPGGLAVSCVLYIVCITPLFSWRPPKGELRAAAKAALGILPFAIAFGTWLAILWHGPTNTLPGSPSGDLAWYAGMIWSLAHQAYPLLNLGYEGSSSLGYFNVLFPAIGAVFANIPGFDPFLFLLGGGGACYVVLLACMIHLYLVDRHPAAIGGFRLSLLVLAVLAAARYPYWVVETVPLVFSPALAISVFWMAQRHARPTVWISGAMGAALVGSVLSKVVTAALLVPLGAAGLWSNWKSAPRLVRWATAAIAAMFTLYCAIMLQRFLPFFLKASPIGPESLQHDQWWNQSRDIAILLLILASWLVAEAPIALALSLGFLTCLLFFFLSHANFVCGTIVLGLIATTNGATSAPARLTTLLAILLALPAVLLSDPAGGSSALVWVFCLGGATLVATLTALQVEAPKPLVSFRQVVWLALFTTAFAGVGFIGIGRGVFVASSGWDSAGPPLTPQLKDIWSAVRRLTPTDALIFTDQVDETIYILGGWNTYAYSGQRQIYLSSYYTSLELRVDRAKLRAALATNESVLKGANPDNVPTRRRYQQVFAVISAKRSPPPGWTMVYGNNDYVLFKINRRGDLRHD
ncbi:hypothetical protein [Bradyrhizobium sp. ORS 111]|uniref:hypothetical protein n=1 Tax=Bradyrhizobium sp. ORS 111 TaxID=1685958 RepID=UPI00388F850D